MKITLKQIGFESLSTVQEILNEVPTYMLIAEGLSSDPNAAQAALSALPPNCSRDQKYNFLVLNHNQAVGFVDVLKDYPNVGTLNLGLLAIRESCHKKNIGQSTYQLVEAYAKENLNSVKVRLAFNEHNPVEGFWKKMGFLRTGESKTYKGVQKESLVFVMEKIL